MNPSSKTLEGVVSFCTNVFSNLAMVKTICLSSEVRKLYKSNKQMNKLFWWLYFINSQRGWKHCPEEAHLHRWAKRWVIIKYNHQKSLFICLFDWKPGGKRYETTW